ncbi:MAG TPA: alpha/beta hydrolase [Desulfuromonadales bacterium]
MSQRVLLLLAGLLLTLGGRPVEAAIEPYFYPFVNPYEATVVDLPEAYMVKLPEKVPTKVYKLKVFPERKIPDVFWYQDGISFSLAPQKKKAPLIFVIAGTGARFDSPTMLKLQRTFYQAGYHVISISSPVHMDFIVNASTSSMPGEVRDDARDLYRVMQMAWDKVRDRVEVSEFALTGYSLGGIQAAFVAMLDEEKKLFDFKKVLLINPPANLFNSVSILDRLLTENIPGGMQNINVWFQQVLANVAALSKEMEYRGLSGEFLYKAYKLQPPKEENLKALIGLAFRMDSANMAFTADVMNGGGFIVPTKTRLNNSTNLTPYALVAYRTSFVDYFHEYFYPYFRQKEPGLTEQALIERLSLRSIEPYLRSARKIGLVHNEDDVIMAPGEVAYLQEVFGPRAKIFPTGGHMGNVMHPDFVRSMTDFLTGKEL